MLKSITIISQRHKQLSRHADFAHRVWCISPDKFEGATDISCFLGNIFMEFGESGGSRQIKSQLFIYRLCTGGVLNYTQHSQLIRCILYLLGKEIKKKVGIVE